MNYQLILPDHYIKPQLPGRDEWIADLRANPDKQGTHFLHSLHLDTYCCLGRLCLLQGRLRDGRDFNSAKTLSMHNPMYVSLGSTGDFPFGVMVFWEEQQLNLKALSKCNDAGFTFAQIADIITAVWDNAPRNW